MPLTCPHALAVNATREGPQTGVPHTGRRAQSNNQSIMVTSHMCCMDRGRNKSTLPLSMHHMCEVTMMDWLLDCALRPVCGLLFVAPPGSHSPQVRTC